MRVPTLKSQASQMGKKSHQENEGFQASMRVVEGLQTMLKGSTLD